MPIAAPPVRGVHEVHRSRIAALVADGRLPTLPAAAASVSANEIPDARTCREMRWFVAGRETAPSGIMAVRPRFMFAYMRRVLEIEHIAGSKFGVVRLLRQAQVLAAAAGMPLTGETAITNLEMLDVALGMDFRKERARVTWVPL